MIRIAEKKEKTIENICCSKQKRSNSYDLRDFYLVVKNTKNKC